MSRKEMSEPERALMEKDLIEWAERTGEIADRLVKEDPTLNPITAHIIAGDVLSAEKATAMVRKGESAEKVYVTVGSYARWDWVISMLAAGEISEAWFTENIAHLWRGADPDDTSQTNLRIWQQARAVNHGYIRDGRPLPKADASGLITIFRGGRNDLRLGLGIAWTTDPKIAKKFALGAGERMPIHNGVVITGRIFPSQALAYLTGRGESEVIVDPRLVTHVKPTRR